MFYYTFEDKDLEITNLRKLVKVKDAEAKWLDRLADAERDGEDQDMFDQADELFNEYNDMNKAYHQWGKEQEELLDK